MVLCGLLSVCREKRGPVHVVRWCVVWLPLLTVLHAAGAEGKPNIVVLFADDLGYGELGCQGNDQIPTPHIDSIAEGGVRFTNGYVTEPVCSPSRAGLMTGRYQHRFGWPLNDDAIS